MVHRPFGLPQQFAIGRISLWFPIERNHVPLIEHHLHRQALLTQKIDNEGVTTARQFAALEKQQHLIHFPDRRARALNQALPQQVMWLMNTWSIHQDQLSILRSFERRMLMHDPWRYCAG